MMLSLIIHLHFKHRSPVETRQSFSFTCVLPMESCEEKMLAKGVLLCLMPVTSLGFSQELGIKSMEREKK